MNQPNIFPPLKDLCDQLSAEFDQISEERKEQLNKIGVYFSNKYKNGHTPKATVICTHNSRRSHMGQLWISVAAAYYGLPAVDTYSGGTAITAFNPRAVNALQVLGFDISTKEPKADNPVYQVRWNEEMTPYSAFSKCYDDSPNPSADFAAIMVCTSADKGCPLVPGCDFRLALPFNDPKAFDDTPLAAKKYEERGRDIGREFLYVFSKVEAISKAEVQ